MAPPQETGQARKTAALTAVLGLLSEAEAPGTTAVPGAPAGPQSGAPFVPGAPAEPQSGTPDVPGAPAGPQSGAPFVPSVPAVPQAGSILQPSGASGGGGKKNRGGKKKSPTQTSGASHPRILTLPRLLLTSLVIVLVSGVMVLVIVGPHLSLAGNGGPGSRATGPASTSTPVIASAATVTITPTSQQLSNTFTIDAVTGTPTAQQVQARQLSAKTQSYSKTVPATGQGMTAGTSATGTLNISNKGANSITVTAGTVYSDNACELPPCVPIHMVVDQTVNLSGNSNAPGVPAHVQEVGTIGNIASGVFGSQCCSGNLYVSNGSPFTGGTDPQPYTYVQQSDINNAANSLISANQPDPQQVLQPQVQSNERFAGTPQCTPNVSFNHPAGARVSQVTVSVNFTCTGKVYDYDGALMLAAQELTQQAATNPGAAYALVGQIKTTLNAVTPGSGGMVALSIAATGVWAYQFSTAQQSTLASMIVGLTPQAAQQLLASQPGVAQVMIQLSGANAQVLPTDPASITIVVQAVPGA